MKHPLRSDFHTVATAAGVTVTFKPTNSIYSFYRLSGGEDVTRLGPVSSGTSGDTGDYPPDEVQATAQRVASEVATSVWSVQNEEVADRLTTIHPATGNRGD